jgi:hypothetical protein
MHALQWLFLYGVKEQTAILEVEGRHAYIIEALDVCGLRSHIQIRILLQGL